METISSVIVPVPELLRRNNYEKWSIFMQHYLKSHDLWDIVQSGYVPEDKREWDRKNALALHTIKISCGAKAFDEIKDMVSARDTWDKLASTHPVKEHVALDINEDPEPDQGEIIGPENHPIIELLNGLSNGKMDYVLSEFFTRLGRTDLETKDKNGDTALSLAACNGRLLIAKLLVKENEKLLTIKDAKGKIPVQLACERSFEEVARYLYRQTPCDALSPEKQGCGLELLKLCMNKKIFGIPVKAKLIKPERKDDGCQPTGGESNDTKTAVATVNHGDQGRERRWYCKRIIYMPWKSIKLLMLAIYEHGSWVIGKLWKAIEYSFWVLYVSLLYLIGAIVMILSCLPCFYAIKNCLPQHLSQRLSKLLQDFAVVVCFIPVWTVVFFVILGAKLIQLVLKISELLLWTLPQQLLNWLGLKQIYYLKLKHAYANEVLQSICRQLSKLNRNEIVEKGVVEATFLAIKSGIPEIAIEFIKANRSILWSQLDPENHARNMFVWAVIQRQEDVARFLHGFHDKIVANATAFKDVDDNTILHVAAKLAPDARLTHMSSAAMQLQSELKWFKAIEDKFPRFFNEVKNKDGETPSQVFIREHKNLLKEAEGWMKKTAESATVVGALIITIMFAVAFTVPGGNNQETGIPIFSKQVSFKIFLIFNALSLSAASSSVLMFFGILTSRYAWEDFFKSLPLKLNIGLSLLFISIATMMGAFCAAVFIMLQGQLQMVIPITLLANAPAIFFIMLQFPLFLEIYTSTFRLDIFQKNMPIVGILRREIVNIIDMLKAWTTVSNKLKKFLSSFAD